MLVELQPHGRLVGYCLDYGMGGGSGGGSDRKEVGRVVVGASFMASSSSDDDDEEEEVGDDGDGDGDGGDRLRLMWEVGLGVHDEGSEPLGGWCKENYAVLAWVGGRMVVVDVGTGEIVASGMGPAAGGEYVYHVVLMGNRMAVIITSNRVLVLPVADIPKWHHPSSLHGGRQVSLMGLSGAVRCGIAISPSTLVVGLSTGALACLSLSEEDEDPVVWVAEPSGGGGSPITSLAWIPWMRSVVSIDTAGVVLIWNLVSLSSRVLWTLPSPPRAFCVPENLESPAMYVLTLDATLFRLKPRTSTPT